MENPTDAKVAAAATAAGITASRQAVKKYRARGWTPDDQNTSNSSIAVKLDNIAPVISGDARTRLSDVTISAERVEAIFGRGQGREMNVKSLIERLDDDFTEAEMGVKARKTVNAVITALSVAMHDRADQIINTMKGPAAANMVLILAQAAALLAQAEAAAKMKTIPEDIHPAGYTNGTGGVIEHEDLRTPGQAIDAWRRGASGT